ncbi:MAG: Fe-S cluster assembly sulfur transfer protein SufU [bacterium]
MEDLRELYQQVILDHNKNPKNFTILNDANHTSEGYNPLCGDKVNIYLKIEDDIIKDISFQGSGCAISKASASVMTTELKGKAIVEAKQLFEKFQKLITGELDADSHLMELGRLAVFAGVREFPVRVKCAALAWHTMIAALENENKVVSTE